MYTLSDEARLAGYQFDWQRAALALALRIYEKTALEYFDRVLPTIAFTTSLRTQSCSVGSKKPTPNYRTAQTAPFLTLHIFLL